MVEIMQTKDTTLHLLNSLEVDVVLRPYLGMSELGHSCERYLWYTFRWCYTSKLPMRIKRLFNRGDREEEALIEALAEVGVRIYNQQEEVSSAHGHVLGHTDGRAIGVIEAPKTEHLAEFKTMNDKYFKQVCKEGVQVAFPKYYAQQQSYMKHTGLTRSLFVATNKNNDAIYIERVYYDEVEADRLERKAEEIVLSEVPPKKRFKPIWWECKFCDARYICHEKGRIEANCRTCNSCDLLPRGKWGCSKYKIELAIQQQRLGCPNHNYMDCFYQ